MFELIEYKLCPVVWALNFPFNYELSAFEIFFNFLQSNKLALDEMLTIINTLNVIACAEKSQLGTTTF